MKQPSFECTVLLLVVVLVVVVYIIVYTTIQYINNVITGNLYIVYNI